ncbi:hypothetical protein MGWOODY_Mmi469 [hydrothermal vent metagenome]|uniref:Uncharacterized protein n=1 Tax=hydrothermal vent metagenome TaxID=652676 RepID=A0A170QD57_9ZZZZ
MGRVLTPVKGTEIRFHSFSSGISYAIDRLSFEKERLGQTLIWGA